MGLLEWLGFSKRVDNFNLDVDMQAIENFLDEVSFHVRDLSHTLADLRKLSGEASLLTDPKALKVNMSKQISLFDHLLVRYQFYQQDTDINGIRVKRIARHYKEKAKDYKLYSLLEMMKKEDRWFFDW